MKISIIAVGKIKEKYFRDGIIEYLKRLSKFSFVDIVEIEEANIGSENEAEVNKALKVEGDRIIKKLATKKSDKSFIFALDIQGKELSTIEFHKKFQDLIVKGTSELIFIIGGSYGLSSDVKKLADFRFSFSRLTFPHQLFRLILLEQIYRVFKIEHNEPYHK